MLSSDAHCEQLQSLRQYGWQVDLRDQPAPTPDVITSRYPTLVSSPAVTLMRWIRAAVGPDQTSWFLTAEDYLAKPEPAWRWNEFELRMFEYADPEETTRFWDQHLPFMFMVRTGHSYCAVPTYEPDAVMHAIEHYHDEPMKIAESLSEFLDLLCDTVAGKLPHSKLMADVWNLYDNK